MVNNDDFKYEEQRLAYVIKCINDTMNTIISKRKKVKDDIIDLREKALEEFKDDEDKLVEYFDHEKYVEEENYNFLDRKLKELSILFYTPYFGRIDFKDFVFNEESSIYIGRFGLNSDKTHEMLVVDWRAPVASLYYNGSLGKSSYDAPKEKIDVDVTLKRQYIIKKQKLIGMFDSDREVKDEILQMVLSQNAGDKLKNIVMTIQAEQDEIIRQGSNKTIVVNGAAGSGKTTIALHRVAYLLYNNRDKLQNKVLILGPNDIFIDYIYNVLPSLGEVGVRQETFFDFAVKLIGIQKIMSLSEYMEKIFSGDEKFIAEVKYKTSEKYLNVLDNLISDINKNDFKCGDLVLRDRKVISQEEIEKMYYESFANYPFYKRCSKIKRIVYSKLKDVRNIIAREINKEYADKIKKLSEEDLNNDSNNLNFKRREMIRDLVRETFMLKKSIKWFDTKDVVSIYNNFNNNKELTADDLSPILYLKAKLEGFKIKEDIRHIVIDEAQDYSIIQFRALKEITNCKAYTVVGDVNQKMMPSDDKYTMLNLKNVLTNEKIYNYEVINYNLNKSYRSTKEIMEYASKYTESKGKIEAVRSGEKVEEEDFNDKDMLIKALSDTIEDYKSKEYESIALICSNLEETEETAALLKAYTHVNIVNSEDIIYKGGTVAIPSYFAKGMEFDAVIIVKNKNIEYDNNLMYIMCTRALHKLCVYSY